MFCKKIICPHNYSNIVFFNIIRKASGVSLTMIKFPSPRATLVGFTPSLPLLPPRILRSALQFPWHLSPSWAQCVMCFTLLCSVPMRCSISLPSLHLLFGICLWFGLVTILLCLMWCLLVFFGPRKLYSWGRCGQMSHLLPHNKYGILTPDFCSRPILTTTRLASNPWLPWSPQLRSPEQIRCLRHGQSSKNPSESDPNYHSNHSMVSATSSFFLKKRRETQEPNY